MESTFKDIDVLVVAWSQVVGLILLVRGVPRNIDLLSLSWAIAYIGMGSRVPRIERPTIVPMQRDKQQVWVLLEEVLGAIPMMYIPIKHSDAIDVVLGTEVLNTYGDVVVHAEPIDCVSGSTMMSGRANNSEGISPFSRLNVIETFDDASNSQL